MAGRLLWNELDRPLKLSALSGVLGGGFGLMAMTYVMLSGGLSFFFEGVPGGFSFLIGYLFIPFWFAFVFTGGLFLGHSWMVLLLYPLLLVSGSLSLLGVSLEKERRGVLGFLVFIGSVPLLLGLLLGVLAVIASLAGIPEFQKLNKKGNVLV